MGALLYHNEAVLYHKWGFTVVVGAGTMGL